VVVDSGVVAGTVVVAGTLVVIGTGVVAGTVVVACVDVGATVVVSRLSSGHTRLQDETNPAKYDSSLVSLICRYPVFEG
jgi:siroheme synthase (precorrin-2 oxidase/ferrochelatase)